MATRRNRQQAASNDGFEPIRLTEAHIPAWEVKNVRALSDMVTVFTLDLGIGVSLYNVKAVQGKTGADFIAAAETLGKNGTYYKNYGLYLDKAFQEKILDKVYEMLDNK